jgi:hypothetical protein
MGNAAPDLRYRDPASGPFDPTAVLEVGRPDLVFISRRQRPSDEVMESKKDEWVLLYQDGLAQLWGRASRYGDPASEYFVPKADREIGESLQGGFARWPAIPKHGPIKLTPVSDTNSPAADSPALPTIAPRG